MDRSFRSKPWLGDAVTRRWERWARENWWNLKMIIGAAGGAVVLLIVWLTNA
jgi:hypothetical protein